MFENYLLFQELSAVRNLPTPYGCYQLKLFKNTPQPPPFLYLLIPPYLTSSKSSPNIPLYRRPNLFRSRLRFPGAMQPTWNIQPPVGRAGRETRPGWGGHNSLESLINEVRRRCSESPRVREQCGSTFPFGEKACFSGCPGGFEKAVLWKGCGGVWGRRGVECEGLMNVD